MTQPHGRSKSKSLDFCLLYTRTTFLSLASLIRFCSFPIFVSFVVIILSNLIYIFYELYSN